MNLNFDSEPIKLNLPDASVDYFPRFFDNEEANALFIQLKNETLWQQDDIKIFGKVYKQPRLTSLYGDLDKSYSYSNIEMKPNPWSPILNDLKSKIESQTNSSFTTVLLNLYRDGKDSNGWHADNEKELGHRPIIASLSLGCERIFQMKHNTLPNLKHSLLLEHGSLLIMKGDTQHYWKHQIPKTSKNIQERINLTFREIK